MIKEKVFFFQIFLLLYRQWRVQGERAKPLGLDELSRVGQRFVSVSSPCGLHVLSLILCVFDVVQSVQFPRGSVSGCKIDRQTALTSV